MKKNKTVIDAAIDAFYNEPPDDTNGVNGSNEYIDFYEKLKKTDERLSVLSEDTYDPGIDIMALIEKGEQVKEKRKSKYELLLFICLSSVIIFTFAAICILVNPKVILISQIILLIVMPWVIIPIALSERRRRDM